MTAATIDLPLIWAAILAFAVLAYVLLDGFDLGVGILFAVERNREDRDLRWSIPLRRYGTATRHGSYSAAADCLPFFRSPIRSFCPALYPPIIAMLLALVFRGVAFEFRFSRNGLGAHVWDVAFFPAPSWLLCAQGLVLGGLLQGIHVEGVSYSGGWWDWLTGFTVLCGLAVIVGYHVHAARFLLARSGAPKVHCMNAAGATRGSMAVAVLALYRGGHAVDADAARLTRRARWFRWPAIAFTAAVPILLVLLAAGFWRSSVGAQACCPCCLPMAFSFFAMRDFSSASIPIFVPPAISFRDAAAPHSSLLFLLVGAAITVPMILGSPVYAYSVFKGKVRPSEGYHRHVATIRMVRRFYGCWASPR